MHRRGFGKMPTTFERRLISLFKRSSGFVLCSCRWCSTGQMPVGEDVLGGVFEHASAARGKRVAQAVGDLPQLRHRRGVIRLREDRADDRGDRFARALRDRRQQIPHEVHAAPLPRGPRSAPC